PVVTAVRQCRANGRESGHGGGHGSAQATKILLDSLAWRNVHCSMLGAVNAGSSRHESVRVASRTDSSIVSPASTTQRVASTGSTGNSLSAAEVTVCASSY